MNAFIQTIAHPQGSRGICDGIPKAGLRLADCDRHLQDNPNDVLAYVRRAITLLLLGRDEEARQEAKRFDEMAVLRHGREEAI